MSGALSALLAWLETTAAAQWVSGSLPVTATLSSVHALAFTLVMGGAVVFDLRLLGAVLPQRPVVDLAAPSARIVAVGLIVSIATGVLLFSGKASAVAENGFFQTKMLLLVAAASFHFLACRSVLREGVATTGLQRLSGACGLTLWIGLAVAACAFILFE